MSFRRFLNSLNAIMNPLVIASSEARRYKSLLSTRTIYACNISSFDLLVPFLPVKRNQGRQLVYGRNPMGKGE